MGHNAVDFYYVKLTDQKSIEKRFVSIYVGVDVIVVYWLD